LRLLALRTERKQIEATLDSNAIAAKVAMLGEQRLESDELLDRMEAQPA
jgi:hypothetical protein